MTLRVYILFGAPGSGKSKSCVLLDEITDGKLKVVKKETTRPKRPSDGSEIVTVEEISDLCDIRYSQYNFEYGFSTKYIWSCLRDGYSVAVIVNDIRTIKILNRKLGSLARNIYVHSNIDQKKIEAISKGRYPNKSSAFLETDIVRRTEKIKTIHRKYIENTYLFNSAIINEYEKESDITLSDLRAQLRQICSSSIHNPSHHGSSARVMIIAGGSFTGKDNLVNAMIRIEPSKVMAYQKGTTRQRKGGDKGELLHLDTLGDSYDITYEKNGYQYGLSLRDIWGKLSEEKIVLIVLSDLPSIMNIKKEFSSICTAIYLHANIDPDELNVEKERLGEEELLKRMESVSELRFIYTEHMNIFDHVLLNTSEPEDLYDQAFNILDYYLD